MRGIPSEDPVADTNNMGKKKFRQWIGVRLALVPAHSTSTEIEEAQGRSEETSEGLLRMNEVVQLGDQYLAEKRYEDAKQQYEIAWDQTHLPGIQTRIGEVSLFLREFEKALDSFMEEIQHQPYHLQAHNYLNMVRWFLSQLPSDTNDEAARSILLHSVASSAYRKCSMIDEAVEAFERVVELVPDSATFRRILGNLYNDDGSFEAALREHSRSYELNPNDVEGHHLFGLAVHNKHEFERLVHECKSSGVPNSPYRLAFIADCLQKAGRIEEALEYYQAAVSCEPRDANIWTTYAGTLCRLGRNSEAVIAYKEAAQIGPLSEQMQLTYAEALAKTMAYNEAATVYLAVEQRNPSSVACQIGLSKVMIKAGKSSIAIEHLEKAVKLVPNNSEVHSLLGWLYGQQGQIKESVEHYQKLVEIDPHSQVNRRLLDEARRRRKR
jgi:tetratricopeptide (TPR) repeat protein